MARKGRNGPPGQIPSLPAMTSSEIMDDNANVTPIEPTLAGPKPQRQVSSASREPQRQVSSTSREGGFKEG